MLTLYLSRIVYEGMLNLVSDFTPSAHVESTRQNFSQTGEIQVNLHFSLI